MKIIHTSDWHLGKSLYNKKRYQEFAQFLQWLLQTIIDENIDLLLVTGDIFDTTTPSNKAQELYYNFLSNLAVNTQCQTIITAGNHDSASFLDAPKTILKNLKTHVIGAITDDLNQQIITVCNQENLPSLIVCAVPFLRDRDIRSVELGETPHDKDQKLQTAIANHYQQLFELAQLKQIELNQKLPIIATGHLFAQGCATSENDTVRDLYVGSLGKVPASIFHEKISYTALGHLHIPQIVAKRQNVRYCGSPLPMNFSEAEQQKSLVIVQISEDKITIDLKNIPTFQKIKQLKGNLAEILQQLESLKKLDTSIWLEIHCHDPLLSIIDHDNINKQIENSSLEILSLRLRKSNPSQSTCSMINSEELCDLTPNQLFQRCLEANKIPHEDQPELLQAYEEILYAINNHDPKAL
ncbi:MAG: exonuclease SbcCD subunit D C-terminal domain-containing protein [Lentisphaeria bacterium]